MVAKKKTLVGSIRVYVVILHLKKKTAKFLDLCTSASFAAVFKTHVAEKGTRMKDVRVFFSVLR